MRKYKFNITIAMNNLYTEIERQQQDEVRELEVESAKYTEAYNNLKQDKAFLSLRGGFLRTVEYLLYAAAAVSIVAFVLIETWDLKMWSNLVAQGESVSSLNAALMTASTFGWKLLAVVLFGTSLSFRWLIGRIRNKNRVMHQQAELLSEMLNKLGTNLYKVKKAQVYFESLADVTERKVQL
ncbi:MAG TPA: hypothetical protein VNZ45_12365 [Bacteroidia bacterium]|nr:hypothetical protein [Bacteroidia bacterium]